MRPRLKRAGPRKCLEILALEGHAHATRAATTTGQLGGGHDQKVEAFLVENVVGDIVALVHHDGARLDAQRVGTVIPLLTSSSDRVAATAGDELDAVNAGGVLENLLEGVGVLLDVDLALGCALGQLENAQGAHDGGVNRELVDVDLSEDRVEVHECTAVRDIERKDLLDLATLGLPEDVLGEDIDGSSLGTLRDADSQSLVAEVQDVAALDVGGRIAAEPQRGLGVVRVILEDVLAVQGLAVTRDGIHTVQADAVADAGERVASGR